ncbi:MAG: SpoIIE family protein phosphatase [Bdellovibrionales bacterium]
MSSNRDIQAVHHVMRLFEQAHSRSEYLLDTLPIALAVIDLEGRLYRGNKRMADVVEVDQESLLGQSLSRYFSAANWKKFQQNMNDLFKDGFEARNIEFEMDLMEETSARSYVWNLMPLFHEHHARLPLVTIIGSDVTALKQMTSQKSRMEAELMTAKAIQENLLPLPKSDFGNVRIAGSYIPASECGGDLWYYTRAGDRLTMCIADVTGHGASAALLASAARAIFALDDVIREKSPGQILSILNQAVWSLAKSEQWMTAMIGSLDLKSGIFTYANAAHEPIIMIPAGKSELTPGDLVSLYAGPTAHLGVREKSTYEDAQLKLGPGDRLFCYTDGVFDVLGLGSGSRRAHRLLVEILNSAPDISGVVDHLGGMLQSLGSNSPIVDDVTFFMLEMSAPQPGS